MAVRHIPLLLAASALAGLPAALALGQTADPPAGQSQTEPAERAPESAPPKGPVRKPPVTELDAVTVTVTRSPETLFDVPGTASVIDAEDLERRNAQSPRDAIRYEPGVSIGNNPGRTGATNYTIRGVGGNRVRLQIDDVRVPDYPGTNAGAGTYTRDFVDLENVKRIEIVRGPASALYGSDALGGVVAYVTKDPSDYLDLVGKDIYGSVKTAFNGADTSFSETLTGAGRAGKVQALLLYTRRDGQEVDPGGDKSANPQSYDVNNILGKLLLAATDVDTLRLIGEFTMKDTDTKVRTEESATVLASNNEDTNQRVRLSLDWTHDEPFGFVDTTRLLAYVTILDRQEVNKQFRSGNLYRFTDLDFHQNIYGTEAQFISRTEFGGVPNDFTYGLSADFTTTSRPRDRFQTNLGTGVTTKVIAGETFPNKNFPDTETLLVGAYVQDKISAGRFTILPAVRVDYYHLKPKPDQKFANSNVTNFTIDELSEVAVSPKLGLTYAMTDQFTLFGQYAHGFRAPPYDDANFGFSNPAFGYEILPNGNLKPEESDGVEAGIRGRFGDGSSFSLAGFYNRYTDFIESVFVGISGGGLQQFQSQNIPRVTIYGAEFRGEWRFMPEWSLIGSAAYAHGQNEETRTPIDSVDPFRVVGGLRYSNPEGFGGELTVMHAWRHDRTSQNSYFKAPSYTVVDLTAFFEILPTLTVNVGMFNLFDAKYYIAQDVVGLSSTAANRGLFAQPGRHVGANVTLRW
ncbi:TonB-dependent hemoglobin/transferrin/lactoferrin family receptor [Desertibaculum subflavum]|uniref:TonB-dependent hemoglobin/transferrin/lactoferrin family receptor n=1 Tax=Desertibaculum subflavum TaxID=2268458 RepID=UPI0013C5100E